MERGRTVWTMGYVCSLAPSPPFTDGETEATQGKTNCQGHCGTGSLTQAQPLQPSSVRVVPRGQEGADRAPGQCTSCVPPTDSPGPPGWSSGMRPGETLYPPEHLALGTRHLPEPGLPWTRALGPPASVGRSRGLCAPHPAAGCPHPLPSAQPGEPGSPRQQGHPLPATGSSVRDTVNRRELPGGQSRSRGQSPWVSLSLPWSVPVTGFPPRSPE